MNLDLILSTNFSFDKRQIVLNELSNNSKVKFALFCAKQSLPYFEQHDVSKKYNLRSLIEKVKLIKDYSNLSKEDKLAIDELNAAANAAYAAYAAANAAAANAANAAAYAANAAANAAAYAAANAAAANAAAYAAYAAYAAAYAANAAAYAAYAAANAAYAAAQKEQMLFLKELVMEELPDDIKDNWLLMVVI